MPRPDPITLQVATNCADCGAPLPAGSQAHWYTKSQKAYCLNGKHPQPSQQGPPQPAPPPEPPVLGGQFPPDEPQAWGFEQKDRLMCRESCAKSAVAIFAASIQAGIYKTHPDVREVTAYAQALESWCLGAIE